jgi:hypothetical protein
VNTAEFLDRLEGVHRNGSVHTARCPAHDDEHSSLSIKDAGDDLVVYCHAGCSFEAIVAAVTGPPRTASSSPNRQSRTVIEAVYPYRDENGTLLYEVVRYRRPKDFRQRRPDGSGGWIWSLDGVRRVPYRLPELLASTGPVFVVEGEKDVERLAAIGITATTNSGGAGKWRPEFAEYLRGRTIGVIPDNDDAGRSGADDVVRSLAGEDVRLVELPGLPDHGDVSDWLDAGHDGDELLRLLADASRIVSLRVVAGDAGPGPRLADVLDDVVALLRRFVYFAKPEQAEAVALWVAHTHAMEAVEQSPILAIPSAVKQSGKSRLLEVLDVIVLKPWRIERPSEAVLYRMIDRDHPTILMDEADTIFEDRKGQYEGIRAVFNAGNRRGTKVPRVVPKGQSFDLVEFDVFCPKAIAGIGRFPETIVDRSIVILMVRRAPDERVEPLRRRQAEAIGGPVRARLAACLADGMTVLTRMQEVAGGSNGLDDRGEDNWAALFAIADLAGGEWPARSRTAALALQADRQRADDNAVITLLADLRQIFDEKESKWLTTTSLLDELALIDASPWSEWRHGKPLTGRGLASLLKPLRVEPDRTKRCPRLQPAVLRRCLAASSPLIPSGCVRTVIPSGRYPHRGRLSDLGVGHVAAGSLRAGKTLTQFNVLAR